MATANSAAAAAALRPPLPQAAASSSAVLQQAGVAGMVCAAVSAALNPFDVTKIRLQLQSGTPKYQGLVSGMRLILAEEGWRGLAKGVEPSVFRELSYSTVRIGAYEPLRGLISGGSHSTETSPATKFFSALVSGGTGAALANPFDLVKTRMQANLPGEKLPYSNTFGALVNILRTEGLVGGLYKGWVVTSTRAAILTSAQLGSYDVSPVVLLPLLLLRLSLLLLLLHLVFCAHSRPPPPHPQPTPPS